MKISTALYWNLFSGSFGHTYGCHPIWQMKTPEREPVDLQEIMVWCSWPSVLLTLYMPGDFWNHGLFFQEYPTVAYSSFILSWNRLCCRNKGDVMHLYTSHSWSAEIQLNKIGAEAIHAYWFSQIRRNYINWDHRWDTVRKFTPPSSGRGNDWVLVLMTLQRVQFAG